MLVTRIYIIISIQHISPEVSTSTLTQQVGGMRISIAPPPPAPPIFEPTTEQVGGMRVTRGGTPTTSTERSTKRNVSAPNLNRSTRVYRGGRNGVNKSNGI